MADPLRVIIDAPNTRQTLDNLDIRADGTNWDTRLSSGFGLEDITYTGMLLPVPFKSGWYVSGTGEYARLRLTDYNIAGVAGVTEVQPGFPGNYYVLAPNGIIGNVYTNASIERNRGFCVSWRTAGWGGSDPGTAIECGWVAPNADIGLRFMSNGDVQVWDGTVNIGNGSIRSKETYKVGLGPQLQDTGATGGNIVNEFVWVCVIPCRHRELLILSTEGGGFNQVIPRIAPDAVDPTITAQGPLWWSVPRGMAQVQMAPLRYATAGTTFSGIHALRYAPGTVVQPALSIYYGTAGYGTATISGTVTNTAGGALGTASTCRFKVTMTGDGISTPWLYGAGAHWPGTVADAWAGSADITSYVLAREPLRLEVPESPTDVKLTFAVDYPDTLDAGTIMPGATTIQNRSIDVNVGSVVLFRGRTAPPEMTDAISDDAQQMTVECRDQWAILDNYRISDPMPLDGLNLGSAVASLVTMTGIGSASLDIGSVDFNLDSAVTASAGEWNLLPDVGDTPGDWLKRLHDDYAPTWYMGWVPGTAGPVFRFKSPTQVGTVPSGTVYSSVAAAGGTAGRVYRTYEEKVLPLEANDIRVVGADPRTSDPIVSHFADIPSQDPTIAGTARPDNWLGEQRTYSWVNPSIQSTVSANWCLAVLRDRLTNIRVGAQVECDMQFGANGLPLWRGDVLQVQKPYGTANYRITSLSMRSEYEAGGTATGFGSGGVWRPTTYVLEQLP